MLNIKNAFKYAVAVPYKSITVYKYKNAFDSFWELYKSKHQIIPTLKYKDGDLFILRILCINPTGKRQPPRPRKELIQDIFILGIHVWKFLKKVSKIDKGIQSILFRGLDYTINDRTRLGTTRGVAKYPIFSSDDKRFDRAFTTVIIDFQSSILEKGMFL